MAECNVKEITIDGIKYVRADAVQPGKRGILVIDRGWIVAGDCETRDGRISVTRAVHVRSWSGIGFDGLIASGGRGSAVVVRPVPNGFDVPSESELFRVPVDDSWGI